MVLNFVIMVKAKLISDTASYKKTKRLLIWTYTGLLTLYLLYNQVLIGYLGFSPLPLLQYLNLAIVTTIIASILMLLLGKKLASLIGEGKIEMDEKHLSILKAGTIVQTIDLSPEDKVVLNIVNPFDSLATCKEYKGDSPVSFIEVYKNGGSVANRFDFVIESHYMMTRLEKLKANWASMQK